MKLEREISDLEMIDVYSETGNTSGTGNHVDCLSPVIFATEIEWSCYVTTTDDGYYRIYVSTPAPFADNIEGH